MRESVRLSMKLKTKSVKQTIFVNDHDEDDYHDDTMMINNGIRFVGRRGNLSRSLCYLMVWWWPVVVVSVDGWLVNADDHNNRFRWTDWPMDKTIKNARNQADSSKFLINRAD